MYIYTSFHVIVCTYYLIQKYICNTCKASFRNFPGGQLYIYYYIAALSTVTPRGQIPPPAPTLNKALICTNKTLICTIVCITIYASV